MSSRRIRYSLEITQSFFLLVGSLLFLAGALGFVIDADNKHSNRIYLSCAVAYTLGSIANVVTYCFGPNELPERM